MWFLALPNLDMGHKLFVDNFYTSLPLYKQLFAHHSGVWRMAQSEAIGRIS